MSIINTANGQDGSMNNNLTITANNSMSNNSQKQTINQVIADRDLLTKQHYQQRKDLQKLIHHQILATNSTSLQGKNALSPFAAQQIHFNMLSQPQGYNNQTDLTQISAVGSGFMQSSVLGGSKQRQIMMNANIQQTLLYPTNLAQAAISKHNTYTQAINKMIGPTTGTHNLSQILSVPQQERKRMTDILQPSQGSAVLEFIQKSKVPTSDPFAQNCDSFSVPQQRTAETLVVDKGQDIQLLKQQIAGVPLNVRKQNKRDNGINQKLGLLHPSVQISQNNNINNSYSQKSNTLLPFITNGSQNSPMKTNPIHSNEQHYDISPQQIPHKSHSVVAKVVGLPNNQPGSNNPGILERDEMSSLIRVSGIQQMSEPRSSQFYKKNQVIATTQAFVGTENLNSSHFTTSTVGGNTSYQPSTSINPSSSVHNYKNYGDGSFYPQQNQQQHPYVQQHSLPPPPMSNGSERSPILPQSNKVNPYSVNYQYINSCFQIQQQAGVSNNSQQLSSEFTAFQGLSVPQPLGQNQRQSKIFRIKNSQQQSNQTLIQEQNGVQMRNSIHSHSNIELGDDVDIQLNNADFTNSQSQVGVKSVSPEPKSAHAANRHSNGSNFRKRDSGSQLASKGGNPPDSHINQILDLINVQHVVHSGLGSLAPPVNCFPVATSGNGAAGQNYQSVFLGDYNQPSASALGHQKTPQDKIKRKKKKSNIESLASHIETDSNQVIIGGATSNIQKSSEFNRDSQFSKYMNQELPEDGKYLPSFSNLQRSQNKIISLRQDSREQSTNDYESRTPANQNAFNGQIGGISLTNQKREERQLTSAEKNQHTLDCAEIIKGHFQERHNSLIRNQQAQQANNKKKKQGTGFSNLPLHIQHLQQQQSEMLLSVLTDMRTKKKTGVKNPAGGMVGGGHPSVIHNNPRRSGAMPLPQDQNSSFLKVSNGINNAEKKADEKNSNVDNHIYYSVLPGGNNHQQSKEPLLIEGSAKKASALPQKLNQQSSIMTKHESQLQQQFFSHIGNKDQSFFDSLKTQAQSPQPIINDLYTQRPKKEQPASNIIKNQCNIILAMISNNNTSVSASPQALAQQSLVEDMASGLNAEVLLSQLSEIVTKCQDLLRQSTSPVAKRQLQNSAMPFQVQTIGNNTSSPRRNQDNQSTISEMIEKKESPLKIIKQVLESRLIDLTNQTVMMQNERRTMDTIKIYEDLLNEITVALEQLKCNNQQDVSVSSSPGNSPTLMQIESIQSDKTTMLQEIQRVSPPNFIKMSGLTPGMSPRIFKNNTFAVKKPAAKPSPFAINPNQIGGGLKPKIQIYHQPFSHLNDHPINQAIQKINYIIKLIFKSGKDTQFNLPQGSNTSSIHQMEEAKLSEIYKLSRFFNIQIPKRFESKTQLREYIQSKEFLVALKSKMNIILYNAINESNGFTQSDLNYFQGVTNTPQQIQSQTSTAQPDQQQQTQYNVSQKFFVGRGNNNALVRSVLKQRSWWVQYIPPNGIPVVEDDMVNEVSFIWTQWKRQKIIDYLAEGPEKNLNETKGPGNGPRLRIYNKMEQNKQLTNKKGVFINMREYYRKIGQDPFDVLPLTFLIKSGDVTGSEFRRFEDNFAEIAQVTKQREALKQEALTARYKELEAIRKDQKKRPLGILKKASSPNKSPNKKKDIYSDYYDEADDDEGDAEQQNELDQDEIVKEIKRRYKVPKNVWIVKPGENTNRGNGINVASSVAEIKSLVSSSGYSGPEAGGLGKDEQKTFIVQKYIDNPLLIHNRKFDFRCYGLLTSINGHLKGYFYEDAYIRTSCKEFDISNLDNKYIHLTNDAVQKNSQDYGKYENGNKMSLLDFQRYLKHLGNTTINPTGDSFYENIDVFRDLMPQIRKLVSDSYRSVYGKIDPGRLQNTFELFGYDFMLDDDFKLNLIEVNTNPCLEISCPLLARIIPEVLDNVFRVVLDPIFHQPEQGHSRKYAINEIPQELKFTLVFDEDIDKFELQKLYSKVNPVGGAGPSSMGGVDKPIAEEMIESDKESELDDGASDDDNQDAADDKLESLVVAAVNPSPSVQSKK